jgi:hypothetical protein
VHHEDTRTEVQAHYARRLILSPVAKG